MYATSIPIIPISKLYILKKGDFIIMKTWKLVSGIISTVLSVFVVFQSMMAGLANSLEESGQSSGSAGLVVSICMLCGGIVSIVSRKNNSNHVPPPAERTSHETRHCKRHHISSAEGCTRHFRGQGHRRRPERHPRRP